MKDAPVFSNLLVFGATAPGILAAVRAAREGLEVALVSPTRHLGGALPSLGAIESHYEGRRAPLLQEFVDRVVKHYASQYGRDSEAFRVCTGGGQVTGGLCTFEPKVAERILEDMLSEEKRIRIWRGYRLVAVDRQGRTLATVTLRRDVGDETVVLAADAFVEAGYEGDLMGLAGSEFRLGREARAEFNEPNAGRVFSRWVNGRFPRAAVAGQLNILVKGATTDGPLPGSTGEGDAHIQSFSCRLCLTDDPANRRLLDAPPPGYDRSRFAPILLSPAEKEKLPLPFHHRFLVTSLREMVERDHLFHGHALPNRKRSWNATNLTGASRDYPLADEPARKEIGRRHVEHALGLMYFLQNDTDVPDDLRMCAREWGLARDEFVEHGNLPPQLYIREARRLVGRKIFTEHDALLAPGLDRAPVHGDSVGITDFSLDSLACTTDRIPGSLCDGQLFQMEVSRPGQVPFGVLLPKHVDNLLVVTTVSATHVGWGTIRQTPTLMHLAESAAWAVVLAARRGVAPAQVDVTALQRLLVERGVMITFFNDFDMACEAEWVPAIQFLGTKGFFGSYDAWPADPVTAGVGKVWAEALAAGGECPGERARRVRAAEKMSSPPVDGAQFCVQAGLSPSIVKEPGGVIARAAACQGCYGILEQAGPACGPGY